jgi:hypothetical protein
MDTKYNPKYKYTIQYFINNQLITFNSITILNLLNNLESVLLTNEEIYIQVHKLYTPGPSGPYKQVVYRPSTPTNIELIPPSGQPSETPSDYINLDYTTYDPLPEPELLAEDFINDYNQYNIYDYTN